VLRPHAGPALELVKNIYSFFNFRQCRKVPPQTTSKQDLYCSTKYTTTVKLPFLSYFRQCSYRYYGSTSPPIEQNTLLSWFTVVIAERAQTVETELRIRQHNATAPPHAIVYTASCQNIIAMSLPTFSTSRVFSREDDVIHLPSTLTCKQQHHVQVSPWQRPQQLSICLQDARMTYAGITRGNGF